MYEPYTCLMSVYAGDDCDWLRMSVDSVLAQSVAPSEFLVVVDGEVSGQTGALLDAYDRDNPGLFSFVRLEQNRGLHAAMREGVLAARHSLVMRMDADDLSRADRAEKLLQAFAADPGLALVGSNAVEFEGEPGNVVARVDLPEGAEQIARFARRRNPFRHDAVMYRREAVVDAGNYRDVPYFEDYDLFLRMLGRGSRAHNVQEPLLYVRAGDDFYQRRGGLAYLRHTVRFLRGCRELGLLGWADCAATLAPRALVCLMPNGLRGLVYRRLLRGRPCAAPVAHGPQGGGAHGCSPR